MVFLNQKIDKYKLIRFIGEGGMAYVYEGIHERLGTRVAVKVLNPALSGNQQIRERFENEVKLLASLDHPNILKVIHYDETQGRLAIVMEYLSGYDLNYLLQSRESISVEKIKHIFFQIMDAFQYAHKQGVVHRDIKPSNIFFTDSGQIKILDFGIAKIYGTGADMTTTGTQIGTPVYMSPEQVKGDRSIDHRSDIYSLGVTLYTLLNGKPPYDITKTSQFDIFNQIVFNPLPDLQAYHQFATFINKAVEKDRQLRFQSIDEMIIAFEQIVGKSNYPHSSASTAILTKGQDRTIVVSPSNSSITKTISTQAGLPKRSKLALLIATGVVGLGLMIWLTIFIVSKLDSTDGYKTYYSGDRSESSESSQSSESSEGSETFESSESDYDKNKTDDSNNEYITDTISSTQSSIIDDEPSNYTLYFVQEEDLCPVAVYVDGQYIGNTLSDHIFYEVEEGNHTIVTMDLVNDDVVDEFEENIFEDNTLYVGQICK